MDNVFVGDIGTRIALDTGVDLTTASVLKIRYEKPNGFQGEWVALQDGANPNILYYLTLSGDLDMAGLWKLQSYIELPAWKGSGDIVLLDVYDKV